MTATCQSPLPRRCNQLSPPFGNIQKGPGTIMSAHIRRNDLMGEFPPRHSTSRRYRPPRFRRPGETKSQQFPNSSDVTLGGLACCTSQQITLQILETRNPWLFVSCIFSYYHPVSIEGRSSTFAEFLSRHNCKSHTNLNSLPSDNFLSASIGSSVRNRRSQLPLHQQPSTRRFPSSSRTKTLDVPLTSVLSRYP